MELFETRFDPSLTTREETKRAEAIIEALDDVASLDQDRILRSYVTTILATTRTNYYRRGGARGNEASRRNYLALKFDPQQLPDLPQVELRLRRMFEDAKLAASLVALHH